MNQRERLLLIVVGLMLAVLGAGFAYSRVSAAFALRTKQITDLQQQISDRQIRTKTAARAKKRMEVYREMSLPADREFSSTLYQSWLLAIIEDVGMTNVNMTLLSSNSRNTTTYFQHTIQITCKGNLDQLARFLHDFYSANYLHRLRNLKIQPVTGSKELSLVLMVDALSLPNAIYEDELNPERSERLAAGDKDEYVRTIVDRNLFSPANHVPKIAPVGPQRGSPNRPLAFTIKAEDPDPLDQVTFSLSPDKALPDAKLDPKTGEFRWTPTEKGEFEIAIVATDNGLPARRAEQLVKIDVTDPPPEPPKGKPKLDFDNAKHTVLTAIIDESGRRQVWLTIRPTGEVLKLHQGDSVNVGSVEAEISDITSTTASFDMEDIRRTVSLGQTLLEGTEQPLKAATEATSENEPPTATEKSDPTAVTGPSRS